MARPKTGQFKVRLNLEMTEHTRKTLEELRVKSSAASFAEVFTRATALYNICLQARADGKSLEIVEKDGTRTKIIIL